MRGAILLLIIACAYTWEVFIEERFTSQWYYSKVH
jgi:hypothetical protein